MFSHLDRLLSNNPSGVLASREINTFSFEGRALPLTVQTGIWKPAGLTAALTIRTTYTPANQLPPYADDVGENGLVRYKYRGTDPDQSDNRALREAMTQRLPLAYFIGVDRGAYAPRYPVWLLDEDRESHDFGIAVDEAQRDVDLNSLGAPQKAYVLRLTQARLHQPIFRARVLRAIRRTVCDVSSPPRRAPGCRAHHSRRRAERRPGRAEWPLAVQDPPCRL